MPFELTSPTSLRLDHVQTRMERHGEEHVPAIDLSLTWTTNNRALDMLHPELRRALYGELQTPADEPSARDTTSSLWKARSARSAAPSSRQTARSGMSYAPCLRNAFRTSPPR